MRHDRGVISASQRNSAQFSTIGAIQRNRRNSVHFIRHTQDPAPLGAILGAARRYSALLGATRRYATRRYSALLGATPRYSALPGATRCYPALPGATRRYPALLGATRRYPALPGATRRYPALLGATRRYSALLGVHSALLGATRRYPPITLRSRAFPSQCIYIYIYLFKGSVPRCILKYGIFRCSKGVWDLVRTLCSYPKPVSCLPSADILGTPTVDDINPALPIIRNIP